MSLLLDLRCETVLALYLPLVLRIIYQVDLRVVLLLILDTYCCHLTRLFSPHPKTQQRHRQGHLIQAHIPPFSNCKDTGEESSSLHNTKHTNHTHATRVQNTTFYSDGATHINNTEAKGFIQMTPMREQSL